VATSKWLETECRISGPNIDNGSQAIVIGRWDVLHHLNQCLGLVFLDILYLFCDSHADCLLDALPGGVGLGQQVAISLADCANIHILVIGRFFSKFSVFHYLGPFCQ
jgi:hypothetical protein